MRLILWTNEQGPIFLSTAATVALLVGALYGAVRLLIDAFRLVDRRAPDVPYPGPSLEAAMAKHREAMRHARRTRRKLRKPRLSWVYALATALLLAGGAYAIVESGALRSGRAPALSSSDIEPPSAATKEGNVTCSHGSADGTSCYQGGVRVKDPVGTQCGGGNWWQEVTLNEYECRIPSAEGG